MSISCWKQATAVGVLLLGTLAATMVSHAWAQEENARKVKNTVTPAYPELARKMKISGVVKVQVTVAPNGTIKDAKVIGGHPVLANAALDAVKQWRYETRPQETTENLEFHFNPTD